MAEITSTYGLMLKTVRYKSALRSENGGVVRYNKRFCQAYHMVFGGGVKTNVKKSSRTVRSEVPTDM